MVTRYESVFLKIRILSIFREALDGLEVVRGVRGETIANTQK